MMIEAIILERERGEVMIDRQERYHVGCDRLGRRGIM